MKNLWVVFFGSGDDKDPIDPTRYYCQNIGPDTQRDNTQRSIFYFLGLEYLIAVRYIFFAKYNF